ncbi:MAG: penicillin-binding protein 1C [Bacteroidota bacterium]
MIPWRRWGILSVMVLVLSIWYANCLPNPLFADPKSTVLMDEEGQLMGARIASDGQWRFPPIEAVPTAFEDAILTFEDKRFYYHPGVDPLAMARAIRLNLAAGEVVSGGSTLSMQVIRLARKGKSRTIWEKLIEVIWATRLELRYSKKEILALYASHAPFGGNVVGLEAAAWKYFGRSADQLSLAESAALAVLPNAPSMIHPGKNRDLLRAKRDKLILQMAESLAWDSLDVQLSLAEALPLKPKALPRLAPHLLERVHQNAQRNQHLVSSTLNAQWQGRINEIVDRYHQRFKLSGIHNVAVLVEEVSTGEVKVYVGNVNSTDPEHHSAVDIIPSRRSTGSILKPFLYAAMLSEGELLPDMLVADIPSRFGGYKPANFDRKFKGVVPASQALSRSLNIPAIRMLSEYGVARFQDKLEDIGLTTFDRSPDEYGLTLVLGGGEATLEELVSAYAGMARSLKHFEGWGQQYHPQAYQPSRYIQGSTPYANLQSMKAHGPLSAASIWGTFEAMIQVSRPYEEQNWQRFSSSRKIAWKTGTSYGFRDAWAIGCTPDHVVGVWVGNADGEGRPELIGSQAAAPILFDVWDVIGESQSWFDRPESEMEEKMICQKSGHLASEICPHKSLKSIPASGYSTPPCPYHQSILIDPDSLKRVNSDCASPLEMMQKTYFVLPPIEEMYYRDLHADYVGLPTFRSDCQSATTDVGTMQIIYPTVNAEIYLPRKLDGSTEKAIFEVAHQEENMKIFWHLDATFIGSTRQIHQMALAPTPGRHTITWIDQNGKQITRRFEILEDQTKS